MYRVFDIHTHAYPAAIAEKAVANLGAFYEFTPEGDGTYADLTKDARKNGMCGYLLFSVATNPVQVPKVNDFIASLAAASREEGFLTVGFAGMHQDYPDMEAELRRCCSLGMRGVKIHPDIQGVDIDDPRLYPLYEMAEGKLPIYFHMGDGRPQYRYSEARKLVRILELFPKLEVVAAHLGGYQAWDEAEAYLAGRPGVWFDTSSALWAISTERAAHLISVFGAENVLFGTDFPVKLPGGELERFLRLPLSEKEREDILFYNAVRFLHLEKEANALFGGNL